MIIQGDIFFFQRSIPKGAKRVKHNGRLKEGELTGHCHQIPAFLLENIEFYYADEEETLCLRVLQETPVIHEEHNPVVLPAEEWGFDSQVEEDPFDDEVKELKD